MLRITLAGLVGTWLLSLVRLTFARHAARVPVRAPRRRAA